ncbi:MULTISPECIES: PIN domain-containing protein [unclassified Streptomyces]|uniref:PIN domain-containing protein n=1 Tax=unclassified Streptomyces TaxID=2593676 RepID=UPI0036B35FB4
MLITPRPGADPRNVLQALGGAQLKAENLRGSYQGSAYTQLLAYLEWATDAAGVLRHQVRDADIDHLVLTRRYEALLGSCGSLAGSAQERLVNGLVTLELAERTQALQAAGEALKAQMDRWSKPETFVVADSSFYIQNPDKLADADLHQILDLRPHDDVRLLFPITVVDELDGLKESGKERSRWRASHTLGLLDGTLSGRTSGVWRERRSSSPGDGSMDIRGQVSVEIVLDQPGHVRLPIDDDEIIDRAVAIQSMASRPVRLLTCDTGQHTRGCAAGLEVTKIPAKDPGPEPDWAEQNKPGNGIRQKRRDRAAAQAAAQPPAVEPPAVEPSAVEVPATS